MKSPNTCFTFRALLTGLASIMWTTVSLAQSPAMMPALQSGNEPAELTQLRQQFTLRALSSTRTLADQYTKALAVLEDQAGAAGDYDAALAAQQRRQQLAAWYATTGMDAAESLVLQPSAAKTAGPVTYERKENVLEGWRTTACSASWDLFKINPGTYTVTMTYGATGSGWGEGPFRPGRPFGPFGGGGGMPDEAPAPDGEVQLSEVTNLGGGAEADKFTLQIKPTGGWTTYETVPFGELKLSRTSARLTLKVTRLRGTSGLMHLREIRLTPAKPTVVKLDDTPAKEFAEEKRAHIAKLAEQGQPILDAYLAKLQRISDEMAERKDDDGVQALLNESHRAQQSMQLLGKETPAGSASPVMRPDGMEEIGDVRYVPDPTNLGDRFLVSTKDQIISVRIMSVSCPSPRAEDEDSQKLHAAYFGITPDDSVAVGRQAREFTDTYLKDKPLRLLTRWMRDKNGSVLAIVQPGEVGDFSGILVDNGLASIMPPRAKLRGAKHTEEAMLASLKEREAAAKAKAIPPGAWSFLPANPKT